MNIVLIKISLRRKPIQIEVCERLMDYWIDDKGKHRPKYHAQVTGRPGIWSCGRSIAEAIGDLVQQHPKIFNVRIRYLPRLPR